jgi:hypothetical protein
MEKMHAAFRSNGGRACSCLVRQVNAGTMAVQVAKRLGAGRVVGAGHDAHRLSALTGIGADLAELPSLIEEIDAGRLTIRTRTVPLREVESVWRLPDVPGERTVIVP